MLSHKMLFQRLSIMIFGLSLCKFFKFEKKIRFDVSTKNILHNCKNFNKFNNSSNLIKFDPFNYFYFYNNSYNNQIDHNKHDN
jgi:hypothetical protein